MPFKIFIAFVVLSILSVSEQVFGRERWLERDSKTVFLHPRRFGQENPAVLTQLSSVCPGQVCGVLAGSAVSTLLGAAGECTQQDMADQIIDAASQFDNATQANMIALAVQFRQVEKNTPPDFSTNPETNRNSVFCQTAPKNTQLNGLVQAQDPANDPNVFFDPATGGSVSLGSQENTFPFGSSGFLTSSNSTSSATSSVVSAAKRLVVSATEETDAEPCTSSVVTVTVGSAETEVPSANCSFVVVTVAASDAASTVEATATADATSSAAVASSTTAASITLESATSEAVVASATAAAVTATTTGSSVVATAAALTASAGAPADTDAASSIGDFGSCTVPQINFGTGFDNRKETSFEPADKNSYNHGSADNIDIITQFMCDTLVNTCGADQTAINTCASAKTAADTVTAKTGGQADAFNAVFGVKTDFAAVAEVDNQGNIVADTGSSPASSSSVAAATTAAAVTQASTIAEAEAATTTPAAVAATTAAAAASGGNLQTFTGTLGGSPPPAVTAIGNGQFQVDGNSAFNSLQSALGRSCDVQNNQCADAANKSGNQGDLTVSACGDQQTQCNALAQ